MPQTFTITLPDDACEYLAANARLSELTPETLLNLWANQAIQQRLIGKRNFKELEAQKTQAPVKHLTDEEVAMHPLMQLAGSLSADVSDISDRHDDYIGESLMPAKRDAHAG